MIKRDITETTYEYDKNGVLTKKTVVETHEEDDETRYPTPSTSGYITPYSFDDCYSTSVTTTATLTA